ncbi:hypothetical protein C5B42_01800 [Candidatus Cerribacteria bacterium 'Amazon FNV 2010 28 9']|uniref:Uncharacterized protein n=1 Tax=Candidatus Cerribacteria bacterium 'Amazon FNV 2010 28 9' TaxID=2081795 RepID=A0A317JQM9_9BACT|nr:MAG: hypothetical protein C5B42_01800 [Candidatus Cerribacteria bacterium 'Amazon FNV 2010 28 9']
MPESESSLKPQHILNENKNLSDPQKGVEGFEKTSSRIKIGGGEREKQYYSIAEKIYGIVGKMNGSDKTYKLSESDKGTLHDIKDSIPDLIAAEDSARDEDLKSVDPSNTTEMDRIRRQAEVNKNKHKALGRYIDKIFEENSKRETGQGSNLPSVESAKVETPTPEKVKLIEFNANNFEDELVSRHGMTELADLKKKTTQFTQDLAVLRPDYFPESDLNRQIPDTSMLRDVNSAIDTITTVDLQNIQKLRAKLNDPAVLALVVMGLDQGQQRDRENYMRHILPRRLDALQKTLEDKRQKFQEKRDSLLTKDIRHSERPEVSQLKKLIDTDFSTFNFTALSNLRQNIEAARAKINIAQIQSELESRGMSPSAVKQEIDRIKATYLDKVDAHLRSIDDRMFDVWKNEFLKDPSRAKEFVDLEKALEEVHTSSRTKSAETMSLYDRLLEARKGVDVQKVAWINILPSSEKQTEGNRYISTIIQSVESSKDALIREAEGLLPSELSQEPEYKKVEDAIAKAKPFGNVSKDSDKKGLGDVSLEEQKRLIDQALLQFNETAIKARYHSELRSLVQSKLGEEKDKAEKEKQSLIDEENRRINTERAVVAAGLRKAVSDVIHLDEKQALSPTYTLQQLENLLTELEKTEREARANGIDIRDPQYGDQGFNDAKEKIQKLIQEKKDISREGIEALLNALEGTQKTFDEQEKLWNELTNDRLPRVKENDPALYAELSTEVEARRNLQATASMVERAFGSGKFIKELKPSGVDLRSEDMAYIFKMKGVGDAWRIFDDVWQNTIKIGGVQISAANFEQNKSKLIEYVASQTNPTAARMAYRLQTCFMRPSEFDREQAWTGKDEVRQVMHITKYRRKYADKRRESGPEITINGFFNEKSNFDTSGAKPDKESFAPVVVLPDTRKPYDAGWDLYPGFLHFAYIGDVEAGPEGRYAKTPRFRDADGKIVDFNSDKYRRADGKLDVEHMPWDQLETDVLKTYIGQMQTVGYEIHNWILEPEHDAKKMAKMDYFPSIMAKWQYLEPYIYRIRDYTSASADKKAIDPKTGRPYWEVAREATEAFRRQWLLGIMDNNFNQQFEGSGNWDDNNLRDVLNAAVATHFITPESREIIMKNAEKLKRSIGRIAAKTAQKLQDTVIESE